MTEITQDETVEEGQRRNESIRTITTSAETRIGFQSASSISKIVFAIILKWKPTKDLKVFEKKLETGSVG